MNRKKYILIAVALLALLAVGISLARRPAKAPATGIPAGKQAPAARVEDSIFVIDGEPVTLADGYAIVMDAPDSAAATVTRLFGEPVAADLDADGDMDAAVLISVDSPGSGTFYYAAAAIKEDWGFRGTEAFLLGDRVAPQTLEVRDAVIIANYADRNPGEPMTARPSLGVSKYLRIEGGELKETVKP